MPKNREQGWSVAETLTFVESDDQKLKKILHLNFSEFAHNSIGYRIPIHAHMFGKNSGSSLETAEDPT